MCMLVLKGIWVLSPNILYCFLFCSVPGRTLDIICKGAIWYGVELKSLLLILPNTFILIPCQCAGMQPFRHAARWDGVEFQFWLLVFASVKTYWAMALLLASRSSSPDYTSIYIHCITTNTSFTSIFTSNSIANPIIVSITTVLDCINNLYDSKRDIAPQRHEITTSLLRSFH